MILCRAMSRAKPSTSRDFRVPATRNVPPTARAHRKTTTVRRRLTSGTRARSFFSVELERAVDGLAGESGDQVLERADRQRLVHEGEVVGEVEHGMGVVPAVGLEDLYRGKEVVGHRAYH